MIYCTRKNNVKVGMGHGKNPQKYNRKAKLHGAMKSIRDLHGWNKIITEMRKGKKSPTDPYIEQILHECVDVLKEAENSEARRLTGLARDLLLFSDLGEVLLMGDRWSVKITGTLELTQSLNDVKNINHAFNMQYMTYGYRDLLTSAAEDEMLSIQELCAVHNPVFNDIFVPSNSSCRK